MLNLLFIALLIFSTLFAPQRTIQFAVKTIDSQLVATHDMAVGDVDGDGLPDIVMARDRQVVWYRNGDWKPSVMVADSTAVYHRLAVRDVDGRAEIAVSTTTAHGRMAHAGGYTAVQYLSRPADPTLPWTPVTVDSGYTVQQLRWVQAGQGKHQLVVLPGPPERPETGLPDNAPALPGQLFAFEKTGHPESGWNRRIIEHPMPTPHNLEVYGYDDGEVCYVVGDGGIMGFRFNNGRWTRNTADWLARGRELNTARMGTVASRNTYAFSAFEPGDLLTVYSQGITDSIFLYNTIGRRILERQMNGGRGLAMADFIGLDREQIVAGWQTPNANGDSGIKLYVPFNKYWEAIDVYWIDRGIACDGLQVADMDNDGRPDIVAYGNATANLKIYWNENEPDS